MIRNTIFVTVLSILASFFGFISQIQLARTFGTSVSMDVYFNILSLPTIFTGIAPVAFTGVLVPYLIKLKDNSSAKEKLVKSIFSNVLLFCIAFIVIGIILGLVLTNNHLKKINLPFNFIVLYVLILIWVSSGISLLVSFFASIHNSNNKFMRVAFATLLPPLFIVISVFFLAGYMGIVSVAFGLIVGTTIQLVLLYVNLTPKIRFYDLKIYWNSQCIGLFKQFIPVVISLLPFTIVGALSYYWASFLPVGSISLIGYSQSFAGILSVASGLGIATVSLPFISGDIAYGDEDKSIEHIALFLKYVLIFSILAATIILSIKSDLIQLLYEHGSFKKSSSNALSVLLSWYLIGAVLVACLNLIRNYFYSKNETYFLAKISAVIPILFFVFSGILSYYFSVNGIGVAFFLTNLIYLIILIKYVKSEKVKLWSKELCIFIFKLALIALIVGFAVSWFKINYAYNYNAINIMIIQTFAILLLFIFLGNIIFKVKEINVLLKLFIQK